MSQEPQSPYSVAQITEDEIAHYLSTHPDFFERHAQTLSAVQLQSVHGQRAVSLAERQAQLLREKIRVLEGRILEMVRNANDNVLIADKLQDWTRALLFTQKAIDLPLVVTRELASQFLVPQVAIKLWDVNGLFSQETFAKGVSDDAKNFAASLTAPFCGVNAHFEAATWLEEPTQACSLALIALRSGPGGEVFGLLVLASPDPQRFNAGMGTDFLERIGEISSAALSRLRA